MVKNGVMLQGFHWFSKRDDSSTGGDSLWAFSRKQVPLRAAGFDAIWLPPQCKAVRTKSGTKEELHALINELHGYRYDRFGDKAEGLFMDHAGRADFLADAGTVAIWSEDGVGLS